MTKRFRTMPATAMAAVLGCALMAMAPNVASAKEEPKKATLSISKSFAPAAKKMQDATNAKDAAALQAALAEGEGAVSTNEDRYWLAFFTLQAGILNKDQALQAKGLDAMLDSGLTPPENQAAYNFFSGRFAYVDKNMEKTIQRLEAAKAAGSTEALLPVLLMDAYFQQNQTDKGIALAKEAIAAAHAAGQRPSDELYVRPIRALQAAKRDQEMLDLMTLRLRDYNAPAAWRPTLFTLLQQSGGNKEIALDTLRLMRATKSMLERAEFLEYAALATEAALPGEVVALIREGKATKVIPATDQRIDELAKAQSERMGDEESTITAYAQRPSTLANPKVAGATGDAMVGYGRYADAIPLYKAAIAAGGDKDLWTYRLGVAQALAGDGAAAKASFEQVTGARKRLAELWMINIDNGKAAAPAAS